jgi:solute carrier family 25 protein 16
MENSNRKSFKIETFISGGIAGCVAKTLVAPIDRVKILRQVHSSHYENYGIFESFIRIPQKEGFLALYKGNLAQLLRIFPYAAFQYGSYETYKSINEKLFPDRVGFYINNLVCGSLAG